ASSNGPGAGNRSGCPLRRGTRYLRTTLFTPASLNHFATSSPSRSHARFQYPPPGQTIIATPVFFSATARKTVIVGSFTFVIHFASLVGASEGARTRSGPIVPKSP